MSNTKCSMLDAFGYFNMEELKALHTGIIDAIAYMEKHGTNNTESVPEGAVRH